VPSLTTCGLSTGKNAEDNSGEAEGDVNGVASGKAVCGETGHGGQHRGRGGFGNIYIRWLALQPRVFFEKRRVLVVYNPLEQFRERN
jgi:hypothetical protein